MSSPSKHALPRSKAPKGKKDWNSRGTAGQGARFADRNLLGVSPNNEQFEPTDACPINGHKRMAGID